MIIGNTDTAGITVLQKRLKRNEPLKGQFTSLSSSAESLQSGFEFGSSLDSDVDTSSSIDKCQRETKTPKKKRMRMALPALLTACDRRSVSDRAADSLATSVLLVNQGNKSQVINQNEARREGHKKRKDLTNSNSVASLGLYFNGRKNQTIIQKRMADGKLHR